MKTFIFGGGCFWCLDALYRATTGVVDVISGYSGGETESPTYYQVCGGQTGHAEVIAVTFDEAIISSTVILDMFFAFHDPTTLNQQGADVGTQYRSIMCYQNEQQHSEFEAARERAETIWDDPIVTDIVPLDAFYEAEPEHQDYFSSNPEAGYCQIVIAPKLAHARATFKEYITL